MAKPTKRDTACPDCKTSVPTMLRIGKANALMQACDQHLTEAVNIVRAGIRAQEESLARSKR